MTLLQNVRAHLIGDPPEQPAIQPNAAIQLQIELRAVVAALLQAQTPKAQAEIYRTVAQELNASRVANADLQTALRSLYPNNPAHVQLISDQLAAHGYGEAGVTTAIQPEREPAQAIQTQTTVPIPATTTYLGKIDYYDGSLLAETIAGGAFSLAIVGAAKAGASTLMRAFIWSMLYEPSTLRPTIAIIDTRCGYWQGLDTLPGLVTPIAVNSMEAVREIALKIEAVYDEVINRQNIFRSKGRFGASHQWKPYLLGIDGWGEVMDFIARLTPKQVEEDTDLKPMFTRLRAILSQGPDIGVSCLLTARAHDRILPDNRSLEETQLLLLGRMTPDFRGGYGPLDRAVNDKAQLPGQSDRLRMSALLNHAKQVGQPVITALSGRPRMAKLPDLSEHNHHDFASAYNRFKPY
jgi:hypothetical protein